MRLKCKGLLKSFFGDINMVFPKFCIYLWLKDKENYYE